jgi:hypothetical protein
MTGQLSTRLVDGTSLTSLVCCQLFFTLESTIDLDTLFLVLGQTPSLLI